MASKNIKKLTCNKVDELIQDEAKGSQEYQELGMFQKAKDEKRHEKDLRRKRREMGCND